MLAVFVITVLSGGIVFVVIGMQKGGFLTLTDVGELPELADVQSRLRPLDLCKVQYGRRGKRIGRSSFEYLSLVPCTRIKHESVSLDVPDDWGRKNVLYELTRSGPDERFQVMVEQAEVQFPDLLGALADHVPVVVEGYTAKLAQERASAAAYEAEMARVLAEEAARKAGAAGSYPTK